MQACSVANIDTAENCKDNHVIRKFIQHWANGLPDSVQNHISPALKDMVDKTGGSIKDYLTLVHRHIVSELDRIVVPTTTKDPASEQRVRKAGYRNAT